MKIKNMTYATSMLGAVTLLLGSAGHARANGLALELTSGTVQTANANASAGWSFTTSQAIAVNALDAFDVPAVGSEVRLYDSSGNTLASATEIDAKWCPRGAGGA